MAEKIYTDKAPAAIGPYSQAIVSGGFVFTSGQIPINPASGCVEVEGITLQAEQVMKNLREVLTAAGTSFDKAVKTTCFLADMGDFAAFNEVYANYFTSKPARSCVAVKTLPKGVLCAVIGRSCMRGIVAYGCDQYSVRHRVSPLRQVSDMIFYYKSKSARTQ